MRSAILFSAILASSAFAEERVVRGGVEFLRTGNCYLSLPLETSKPSDVNRLLKHQECVEKYEQAERLKRETILRDVERHQQEFNQAEIIKLLKDNKQLLQNIEVELLNRR